VGAKCRKNLKEIDDPRITAEERRQCQARLRFSRSERALLLRRTIKYQEQLDELQEQLKEEQRIAAEKAAAQAQRKMRGKRVLQLPVSREEIPVAAPRKRPPRQLIFKSKKSEPKD
jgi:hypothetical protein